MYVMNSGCHFFTDTTETSVVHVTQLERDTILVCLDCKFKYIPMHTICLQILFCIEDNAWLTYPYLLSRLHKNSESARQVKIQPQTVVRAHV